MFIKHSCKFCSTILKPKKDGKYTKYCNQKCAKNFWVLNNKEHTKQYNIKYRKNNLKKATLEHRKWRKNNPEKIRKIRKKYREKHTEERRAHHIIAYSKSKNISNKQDIQNCILCGTNSTRLIQHHENYNKPLETITLCDKCHSAVHKKELKIA